VSALVFVAALWAAKGLPPPERAAAERITANTIAPHIRFLADDLLEGRSPGSRGEKLATSYIAAQMESFGLEPAGENGTFFQRVPLVGIVPSLPDTVTVKAGQPVALALTKDLVVMSGVQATEAKIGDAEIVFVGYGIVAPEYEWDDYQGVDVKGKVVLVMNNDPANDPKLFAGKTRLWYGRWDYKYLTAAKHGAAGAIIIHTTPSAGYPWQVVQTSNTGEKFELPQGDEPRLQARMWITEDGARRVVEAAGKNLDALRTSAEARTFRAVPLGARLALTFKNTVRKMEGANVAGILRGTDAKLKDEAVVLTAHHDHLGIRVPKNGDAIYNGAVDNASGVATLLAVARAAAAAPRPKRSLLFLTVTAEEQGLLGSEWFCRHPVLPPGRMAANLNLDSVNIYGRTTDVGFIGLGKSSLDAVVEAVAKAQGRTVHGDAFPDRGSFYRSDQFNFAKLGVPALFARGGPTYVGRPAAWGREQADAFEKTSYHQPSDEYDPKWDLSGAVEDAQLYLLVALRIASTPALPAWRPGDEFEAARKAAAR
jgi:Zn-dependent M28 family amino/carboxypeptidase